VDWDRRLFDALIPLPEGTSYNSYVIKGSEKTALLDTVDPPMAEAFFAKLQAFPKIDYLVAHHGEQDHSGLIGRVLEKYPQAKLLCTPKAKDILMDHLGVEAGRIQTVADNETISLGDRTLKFMHAPWVHWPETMLTWLEEEKILFTCDLFGAHLAQSGLYAANDPGLYSAAKRYYAEIMSPFRAHIRKHMERVAGLGVKTIAPSHGPVYDKPEFILKAYQDWAGEEPKNLVLLPYVSMHGSTRRMVEYLAGSLAEKGVKVEQVDLSSADLGHLAALLVDAATLVLGTPTVLGGAHPAALYAAVLANALRPKLKFASVIGSFGWAGKAVEQVVSLLPNLKVEIIPPVLCKGRPKEADYKALEDLAGRIAEKHKGLGIGENL
jgi:flavorubredoxin